MPLPAQKSVKDKEFIVSKFTNPGDTCLDTITGTFKLQKGLHTTTEVPKVHREESTEE